VLDGGGRGATTTFAQRSIGDALVTFESRGASDQARVRFGDYEVVYPSLDGPGREPGVSVVDKVVDRKGTRSQPRPTCSTCGPTTGRRSPRSTTSGPRGAKGARQVRVQDFPEGQQAFTVDEVFGGWAKAQKDHFDDGGQLRPGDRAGEEAVGRAGASVAHPAEARTACCRVSTWRSASRSVPEPDRADPAVGGLPEDRHA
jgi:ABC-type sulfate transport system substrate-binding protein